MRQLYRWNHQFSTEATNEILRELALSHLSREGGNESIQSSQIRHFVEAGDFRALCDYELDYEQLPVHEAIHLRQVLAFYQKRQDLDLGIDKRAVAQSKFLASELLCLETNRMFKALAAGRFHFSQRVNAVLHRAQRKIAVILGDVPNLEDLRIRFGVGATTQIPKRMASARRKLSQKFACSEELLSMIPESLEELPGWISWEGDSSTALVAVEVHRGVLNFVPKTAKTDRAIVVEPMLNTMFQLGIGSYIAERLRPYGVDTRDQTKNQNFACIGSLTGALATLDLSSASDTIATELVYHLLPYDWALFLDRFRTSEILIGGPPGKIIPLKLQKFSSMGNGFTFPLETLIFYALARACSEDRDDYLVTVYGDDIIIPTYAYPLLEETLRATGFILNRTKSFASGPFRESCGKDYLRGIDIRPCYIKGPLAGSDIFILHNHYVRHGDVDRAQSLLRYLDPRVQIWGPDGYGDGHLLGDWIPRPKKRSEGWAGYTFDTYTLKSRKDWEVLPGDRVLPVYNVYLQPAQPGVPGIPESQVAERRNETWGRRAAFHNVAKSSNQYRRGFLGVTLPGTSGYKRISIYTLSTR